MSSDQGQGEALLISCLWQLSPWAPHIRTGQSSVGDCCPAMALQGAAGPCLVWVGFPPLPGWKAFACFSSSPPATAPHTRLSQPHWMSSYSCDFRACSCLGIGYALCLNSLHSGHLIAGLFPGEASLSNIAPLPQAPSDLLPCFVSLTELKPYCVCRLSWFWLASPH